MVFIVGVSIATLTGQNGILTRAQDSKTQTGIAEEKEAINLAYSGAVAEKRGTGDITADERIKVNCLSIMCRTFMSRSFLKNYIIWYSRK